MVVIDVFTRRLIGFGIVRGDPDGVDLCRMFNHAIAKHPLPNYVSTDNDSLFRFHRWLANLRVVDSEEIKTVPFVPQSHPFVERLIGTLRREYLELIIYFSGTAPISSGSSTSTATITTNIVPTPDSAVKHQIPMEWEKHLHALRFSRTGGSLDSSSLSF